MATTQEVVHVSKWSDEAIYISENGSHTVNLKESS